MNKRIQILFYLLLAGSGVTGIHATPNPMEPGDTPQKAFELRLKINGFANGPIKLFGIFGDVNYGIDSVFADEHGNATFQKDTALPGGLYFIAFPDQTLVQVLVDSDQQFNMAFDKKDIISSMKIEGSLDNDLLYQNLKFESVLNPKFTEIQRQMSQDVKGSKDYKDHDAQLQKLKDDRKAHIQSFLDKYPGKFFTRFKVAGQNPEFKKFYLPDGSVDEQRQIYYYRLEYWNGYDFSDNRLLRNPVYSNKLKKYIEEVTPQIPDSIIKYADWVTVQAKASKELFKFTANWIAVHYKDAKILGRESVFVFMVEKFWTADQAYWSKDYEIERIRAQARQMKPSLIGQTGQDVKGINEFDQPVSIYGTKSPVTVVYIFSYDCENCKKETPELIRVYQEWRDKGFDIFSICIDGDKDKWQEYLQKNGMTFHNIFDPDNETNFRLKYYVDITPEIYVLDKDRKIIASNINSKSLTVILKRELGM